MPDQPATVVPPYGEELLTRARRALAIGQTWWIDGVYARRPAYAYAIDVLEAEGCRVDREPDMVTVRTTKPVGRLAEGHYDPEDTDA